MVKKDLIEKISSLSPDFRKKDIEYIVDLLFERLSSALAQGERIEIRGLGCFLVKEQKSRLFINPKTKKALTLPPRKRIIFKAGKDIKERLNQPVYAVLDLGTQSFRLLLAKKRNSSFYVLQRYKNNVRLGEGLNKENKISQEAQQRGLKALKEFQKIMQSFEVKNYLAAGTAVFRKASNKEEFLTLIQKEIGLEIKVLSPQEEAFWTRKGVFWGMKALHRPSIICDVGGGSTELIFIESSEKEEKISLDIGAVTLTEKFFSGENISRSQINKAKNFIREKLKLIPSLWKKPKLFVGTGGTASCIGSLYLKLEKYIPERLHGESLPVKYLLSSFNELCSISRLDRASLRGMEQGREDIIIGGQLIFLEIMKYLETSKMIISETGLLEGLLHHFIEKNPDI